MQKEDRDLTELTSKRESGRGSGETNCKNRKEQTTEVGHAKVCIGDVYWGEKGFKHQGRLFKKEEADTVVHFGMTLITEGQGGLAALTAKGTQSRSKGEKRGINRLLGRESEPVKGEKVLSFSRI